MARVFLSSASPDKPVVRRLAAALRSAGHDPWLDEEAILVGESIPAAVERGLHDADFVVLCLSKAAAERGWIEAERDATLMQQFRERRGRILPVRLEEVAPPHLIASIASVDLFPDEQAFTQGIARLTRSIDAHEARRKPGDSAPSVRTVAGTQPLAAVTSAGRSRSGEITTDAIDGQQRPPWAPEVGHDQYGPWAAFKVRGVQQRMRWIPPGRFKMGSLETELGRYDQEGPQHEVTISRGFWLGETPVTQALWVAVMGDNPSRFRGERPEELDRPVEQVSWYECQAFLDELNGQVAELAARLPSEAEWERACRAETRGATWTGELSGKTKARELEAIAWYRFNSNGTTHMVGRKAPNPYGLCDMLGNVWEWCQDAALGVGEPYAYAGEPVLDPVPHRQGAYRVARGASWLDDARHVRAASRYARVRDRDPSVGFRLAGGQAFARR